MKICKYLATGISITYIMTPTRLLLSLQICYGYYFRKKEI